jgi:hypothetical protein
MSSYYTVKRHSAEYDKQDQQGKVTCNERNPNTTQQHGTGAQEDRKQKQDTAQGRAWTG